MKPPAQQVVAVLGDPGTCGQQQHHVEGPDIAEEPPSVQKLTRGLETYLFAHQIATLGILLLLLCKNRRWITLHLTNGCPALLKLPTQIELCFFIGVYSGCALEPALISPKQDKCTDLSLPAYILSHSSKLKCHQATEILLGDVVRHGGCSGGREPVIGSYTLQVQLRW